MIPLMDLLTDEGRKDLIRGNEVALLNVEVQCPPTATKSSGQAGNCEPCFITSAFRDGEGWPAEMLSKIRSICKTATDDFCDIRHPVMDEEQREQARVMAVFRSHETVARFLPYIMAGVFTGSSRFSRGWTTTGRFTPKWSTGSMSRCWTGRRA